MNKEQILSEIKKTAEENAGAALGMGKFLESTGIRRADWEGKYWAKWSDAIKEAGYMPNKFSSPALDTNWLITQVIELIRELQCFPSRPQLKIKHYNQGSFPSSTTITNLLGQKPEMMSKILQFCEENDGYDDVKNICSALSVNASLLKDNKKDKESTEEFGYVYLFKSGKYYKVGKTNHVGRRDYELKIQLPEKVKLVHQISTDDPTGIEAYWHGRFGKKRKNGEWFDLNSEEIKAFKKRKFM